ncbi:hypothetical protein FVE85_4979 [Porphyridium purpureum]|uniref:Uncharacterized protein n=1 Tax=Porphyridium purpureum TaxID=35688 RepID=A0A5J4YSL2_PORPP|nr:hypothetical protein FVE85_4979 [Porphyridium purpureum]|eukprot:POR4110..scf236_6
MQGAQAGADAPAAVAPAKGNAVGGSGRALAQQSKGEKAASFRNENALAVKVPEVQEGNVYVEDRRLQTQATDDLRELEMAAENK